MLGIAKIKGGMEITRGAENITICKGIKVSELELKEGDKLLIRSDLTEDIDNTVQEIRDAGYKCALEGIVDGGDDWDGFWWNVRIQEDFG